tara:strand:+ start:11901 stop:12299 length:399 start_codon:yes stop_codon:yes gene_type:complete
MINAVVALITNDFYKEEKYILSEKEDSIQLPNWEIDNYKDLENNVKKHISSDIFMDNKLSNGYINPKFISINDANISKLFKNSDKSLYFLYGCICPKLSIKSTNLFWKSFDIFDPSIQTELGIINEVISKTI